MITVERSKTGLPTIAESGGGATNTGSARIIAGANGERLRPLFVPRGYSNGDHAIFVARVGMLIVDASHDRRGDSVTVRRIAAIGRDGAPDEVETEIVAEWENGDGNIPAGLRQTVDAAIGKSHDYHCRRTWWAGE